MLWKIMKGGGKKKREREREKRKEKKRKEKKRVIKAPRVDFKNPSNWSVKLCNSQHA